MPPAKRSQRNKGPYSSDRALNENSPIVSNDLWTFLVECILCWDISYTEDEKRRLIDMLPEVHRQYVFDQAGSLQCPLHPEFINNDQYLKAAVSRFVLDVADGFYNKSWRRKAEKASEERLDGKFDQYILEDIEERFGDDAIPSDPE